jgi:hypothetical protein
LLCGIVLFPFGPVSIPQPALAVISFVKNIGTNTIKSSGTSISVTVPAAGVAAGNSIIVTFAMDPAAGAVTCTDTAGNSYTTDADVTNGTSVRSVICAAHNVSALVSGNTITVTHPTATARAMSANEFSGLAATATLDKTSTGTGQSTAPTTSATATTTQADELLIGAIGVEGPSTDTFTPGASYTGLTGAGTTGNPANSNITIDPEFRIVSATGTFVANGTLRVCSETVNQE